mmetsp:Transcript_38791/g.115333  ORF Transcript_38791/g.115333 Transcript_38791/m.115333 type:complete len:211 (-) Transcript_38791:1443-2075(-)
MWQPAAIHARADRPHRGSAGQPKAAVPAAAGAGGGLVQHFGRRAAHNGLVGRRPAARAGAAAGCLRQRGGVPQHCGRVPGAAGAAAPAACAHRTLGAHGLAQRKRALCRRVGRQARRRGASARRRRAALVRRSELPVARGRQRPQRAARSGRVNGGGRAPQGDACGATPRGAAADAVQKHSGAAGAGARGRPGSVQAHDRRRPRAAQGSV